MKTIINQRERAVEAARLLSYLMVDLIVGTRGLEIFDSPALSPHMTANMTVGLNRMALSHLVVTLAKWAEFYQRYAAMLPTDVRSACKALDQKIKTRGVVAFRNKVVGHILDKGTQRPLTSQEVEGRLQKVMAGDRTAFFRWVNDPAGNIFPTTVVSITEHVRDRLRAKYTLRDEEIL